MSSNRVTATDISLKALEVAEANARANGVNVEFLQGNMFVPIAGRHFDVIISNPPYVKSDEIVDLPRFVKNFAPHIAINGGHDGLFFHRTILKESGGYLSKNGVIFLECENDQDLEVMTIADQCGWAATESYPNRFGKIRGFMFSRKKKEVTHAR